MCVAFNRFAAFDILQADNINYCVFFDKESLKISFFCLINVTMARLSVCLSLRSVLRSLLPTLSAQCD